MDKQLAGYVYILKPKVLELPLCKIGQTSREPHARCREINQSSTGDLLWSLCYYLPVNDRKSAEKLIHSSLAQYRQPGRELFLRTADEAYSYFLELLSSHPEFSLTSEPVCVTESKKSKPLKSDMKKNTHLPSHRKHNEEYASLLLAFCQALGVKGREFGQLSKPFFGVSDGAEGVQWNLSVNSGEDEVWLGINLEGMKYSDWPIARFLQTELSNMQLPGIAEKLPGNMEIYALIMRDAWQRASRPHIKEQYIEGMPVELKALTSETWTTALSESLHCLDEKRYYKGRGLQNVTRLKRNGEVHVEMMEVSPHFQIQTKIEKNMRTVDGLQRIISLLKPLHEWLVNCCK